MLFTVLYYDTSVSEDDLQEYGVEANDVYEAERLFKEFIKSREDCNICNIYNTNMYNSFFEEPDAHSCRAESDEYGICQVCGAIVSGSLADYELHGYDPPGTY